METAWRPVVRGDLAFCRVAPGAQLTGQVDDELAREWACARADSFNEA